MRVIAGTARSLKLKTPAGLDTRPTNDRIKETLFNMLQTDIPGCIFVDLFAGGGAIGIEALSRGARHAYFVENGKQAGECLKDNLKHTKMEAQATIIKQDVLYCLSMIQEKEVDIIFMDPPYRKGYEKAVMEKLKDASYVTPDTILIAEAPLDADFSFGEVLGFEIYKEKKYKTNQHIFLRRKGI